MHNEIDLVVLCIYNGSMDKDKKDTRTIVLHVTSDMHAKLKAIADDETRSMHAQVVRFLQESIARWDRNHGIEPDR